MTETAISEDVRADVLAENDYLISSGLTGLIGQSWEALRTLFPESDVIHLPEADTGFITLAFNRQNETLTVYTADIKKESLAAFRDHCTGTEDGQKTLSKTIRILEGLAMGYISKDVEIYSADSPPQLKEMIAGELRAAGYKAPTVRPV